VAGIDRLTARSHLSHNRGLGGIVEPFPHAVQVLRSNLAFVFSVTAALMLHAAMFSVPVRQVHALPALRPLPAAMSVRVSTGGRGAAEGGPAHANPGLALQAESEASTEMSAPGRRPPIPPESQPALAHSPPPTGVFAAGQMGDADYFTRDQLSMSPTPLQAVLIDYPPIEDHVQGGNYVSQLSLYIDEEGKVQRVRVDGPALPQPMEEAARSAFMNARFSPGQVDGLPVRSRIRIEVSFIANSGGR
jgi:periplasmic protein TonB